MEGLITILVFSAPISVVIGVLEEHVESVCVLVYQQRRQYLYFCTSQPGRNYNPDSKRRNLAAFSLAVLLGILFLWRSQ